MPKNKKNLKKTNWKLAIAIISGVLIISAVIIQVWLNMFFWNATKDQSAFRMGVLMKSAIDNLDELRIDVGDDSRIPEIRLQLPSENSDVENVRYLHYADDEQTHITSRLLVSYSASRLLAQENMESLFEEVPSAQACSRGFTLRFSEAEASNDSIRLSGTTNLADGRTLYVYREVSCNIGFGIDELEAYLLQAQSY